MAADRDRTCRTDRRPWQAPWVERLVASDAENAYSVVSKDAIYSTS